MPDGSLVPWTSPVDGHAMRIAAATPNIPWTDLAYSLVPNGGTLDYVADAPYNGPLRRHEELADRGPVRDGHGHRPLRAAGHRPRRRHRGLDQPAARRGALRRRPARRRRRRRAHHPPLLLLHRRLAAARADADLQRLHRRPLPGRRGAALLPPHPRHPSGHAAGAVLRQLRPPARAEPAGRRQPAALARGRLAGLLRQGRRHDPVPGRRGPDPDLPQHGAVGRARPGRQLGPDVAGRGALHQQGRPEPDARRGQHRARRRLRPRHRGPEPLRARHRAPTSRAWPTTGCPPPSRPSR